MTITAVSVLIALVVGGIEVLGVIGDQFNFHGAFWDGVSSLGNHFGAVGVAIIAIFVLSWAASAIGYRRLGYQQLEFAESAFPVLMPASPDKKSVGSIST